jgi:hypothetical protein
MKPSISWIPGPWVGKLAILARPRGGDWLADEVEGWRDAGLEVVVSLLSKGEEVEISFARISTVRGVAVPDTAAQREWVGDFARLSHSVSR